MTTTTTTNPGLTVADVFAALIAGESRPLDEWERDAFAGAPEGSRSFVRGEWTYMIGANFQVEAFALDPDNDTAVFINTDGEWVAA